MKLGQQAFIAIPSEQHLDTFVFGAVIASGLIKDNPDGFWIEIEGISTRFYSDRVRITFSEKKRK